jgi:hypothetical protein
MEKMRLVETIPGMGGEEIRENDGGVISTIKNFYQCLSVHLAQQ